MPKSVTFSRFDIATACGLFAALLVLYVRTLAPGLLFGDGGELQTLTYTLGLTHPTGYPVYLVLSRLFAFLPVGDLAYRVNLFSALMSAAAVMLIYLSARQLTQRTLPALVGALAFAVAPVVWWHAAMSEVYTPAAAFLAAILLLTLRWREYNHPRLLFAAGVVGGLSVGVHGMVGVAAPATLLYLLLCARGWRNWLAASGGALLGLLLTVAGFFALSWNDPLSNYFYATVRPSITVWGLTVDDVRSTLGQMKFLYEAQQFHPYAFTDPIKNSQLGGAEYFTYFSLMFSPLARGLMVLGVCFLLLRHWREAIWLLLAWASMIFFVANYRIWDIEAFYVPTYVIPAIFLSLGASVLIEGVVRWFKSKLLVQLSSALLTVVLAAAVLWLHQPTLLSSWQQQRITFLDGGDFEWYPYPVRQPNQPRETAVRLVARLEENAIVFTEWGKLYPYYFVAHVEKGQTGMAFYESQPQGGMNSLATTSMQLIEEALAAGRPVYFDNKPLPNVSQRFTLKTIDANLPLYQVIAKN